MMMGDSIRKDAGTQASLTEDTVAELKETNEKLVREMAELNTKYADFDTKYNRIAGYLEDVLNKAQELEKKNGLLQDAVHKSEQGKKNLALDIKNIEGELKDWLGYIEKLAKEKDDLTSKYNALVTEKASEQPVKRTTNEGTLTVNDISKTVNVAKKVNAYHKQEIDRLSKEVKEKESRIEKLEEKIGEMSKLLVNQRVIQSTVEENSSAEESSDYQLDELEISQETGKGIENMIVDVERHVSLLSFIGTKNINQTVQEAITAGSEYLKRLQAIRFYNDPENWTTIAGASLIVGMVETPEARSVVTSKPMAVAVVTKPTVAPEEIKESWSAGVDGLILKPENKGSVDTIEEGQSDTDGLDSPLSDLFGEIGENDFEAKTESNSSKKQEDDYQQFMPLFADVEIKNKPMAVISTQSSDQEIKDVKAVFVKLLTEKGDSQEDARNKVDAILGYAGNSGQAWEKTLRFMLHSDTYGRNSSTGWMNETGISLDAGLLEQMLQLFNGLDARNKDPGLGKNPAAILSQASTDSTPSNTLPVQIELPLTTESLNLSESVSSGSESADSQTPSSHSVKIGFELRTIYPKDEQEAGELIKLISEDTAEHSYTDEKLTFKLNGDECTLKNLDNNTVDFSMADTPLKKFIDQLQNTVDALLKHKPEFKPSSIDLSRLKVTTDDELKEINEFIKKLKNHNITITPPKGVKLKTEDQTTYGKKVPPSLVLEKVDPSNQVKEPVAGESTASCSSRV